ncbi:MAG: hypothetical protein A6F70_02655 [Cycloclasticus sp. symbiont of Bathymodiolus heckerae]|nr:MAG: hypothetical protein A6F70_02655 [Cycloclasticus sp. symbiont of Bathymodiolus heckerae]
MNVKLLHSISAISATDWNTLFNTSNPFIQHAFLATLEQSQCCNTKTGWRPQHIVVTQQGQLIAAMPCFLKSHSSGEYVFDHAWANAYQQHGLNYYPKLLSAIPFTPSTGPRLAFSNNIQSTHEKLHIIKTIDQAIRDKFTNNELSGWHMLFPESALSTLLKQSGWAQRIGIQYHWFNKDYTSFDHFLSALKSRKRKAIRKERAAIKQQGIATRVITGTDISEELMSQFYRFYHLTYLKRSGQQGYLNLVFFHLLLKSMPHNLVMICALKGDQLIGAALCFKDDTTLFGRYWGCEQEYDFLHFEVCYYQGIEFCIQQKLSRFDSGAQGEHKISRGFQPIKTYSNHSISNPEFKSAINNFLTEETQHVNAYIEHLTPSLPFKESTL